MSNTIGLSAITRSRDSFNQKLTDEDGNIGIGSRKFLQGWMNAYLAWVKKHSA
jgi:hypothetical protein